MSSAIVPTRGTTTLRHRRSQQVESKAARGQRFYLHADAIMGSEEGRRMLLACDRWQTETTVSACGYWRSRHSRLLAPQFNVGRSCEVQTTAGMAALTIAIGWGEVEVVRRRVVVVGERSPN